MGAFYYYWKSASTRYRYSLFPDRGRWISQEFSIEQVVESHNLKNAIATQGTSSSILPRCIVSKILEYLSALPSDTNTPAVSILQLVSIITNIYRNNDRLQFDEIDARYYTTITRAPAKTYMSWLLGNSEGQYWLLGAALVASYLPGRQKAGGDNNFCNNKRYVFKGGG